MPPKLIVLVGLGLVCGCGQQMTSVEEPKPATAEDLAKSCTGLGMDVECATEQGDAGAILVAQFEEKDKYEANSGSVTQTIGYPFCALNPGRPALFIIRLAGTGFWLYSCQQSKWSQFISEIPDELDPNLPPAQMCQAIEKDPAQPFHCRINRSSGMWRLTLVFVRTLKQSKPYLEKIIERLGDPFCRAVVSYGDGALVELLLPKEGVGFRINCEDPNADPKPFRLTPPAKAAQPTAENAGTMTL